MYPVEKLLRHSCRELILIFFFIDEEGVVLDKINAFQMVRSDEEVRSCKEGHESFPSLIRASVCVSEFVS